MRAFFVAAAKVRDAEKFAQYAGKAGASMKPFGGEVVVRGRLSEVLAGEGDHNGVGVVGFPDFESLMAWYASPAYQAIIPLRDEAAEVTIHAYEVPQ